MGIDLSLIARPPRSLSNLFRRLPDPSTTISASVRAVASEMGVESFVPQLPRGQQGDIPIHYLCESAHVSVRSGAYSINVRTNGGGPGYHAFVCDVADHLARTQGWVFAPNEQVDETGYFQSRDFLQLQHAHAEWLKALTRAMSTDEQQKGGVPRIMLALDTPVPAGQTGVTFTPMGPVDVEFLHGTGAKENVALAEAAAQWFPWWNKIPNALDYSNTCRQLMWTEVPWHFPANTDEMAVTRATLSAAELAKAREPTILLPNAEIEELRQFLSASDPASPPKQCGVGYRRQLCVWLLPAGWSLELPGYWYVDHDDGSVIFSFDDMFVRASVFSIDKRPSAAPDAVDTPPLGEGVVETDTWKDGQRIFRFGTPSERQDDKNVSRMLVGAKKDSILLLTFGGDDESFADLALKIARSVL